MGDATGATIEDVLKQCAALVDNLGDNYSAQIILQRGFASWKIVKIGENAVANNTSAGNGQVTDIVRDLRGQLMDRANQRLNELKNEAENTNASIDGIKRIMGMLKTNGTSDEDQS